MKTNWSDVLQVQKIHSVNIVKYESKFAQDLIDAFPETFDNRVVLLHIYPQFRQLFFRSSLRPLILFLSGACRCPDLLIVALR